MTNILLCGGSGTRLFPLSRTSFPKQFIKLFANNQESLFEKTYLRNAKFCEEIIIVSNIEQYFLAQDQLESLKCDVKTRYLLESLAKNTAPAILLAALTLPLNEIVLVSPSDHLIKEEEKYLQCVQKAKEFAESGALVTFGIYPNAPETGFGYIQTENYDVLAFHEKPNKEKAQEFLKAQNYLWNSGIFCFKVESLLKEAKLYANAILKACENAINAAQNLENVQKIPLEFMQKIPSDSLDYAILEKSKNIKVVPSDFGWSDVGSFDSLSEEFAKDSFGNALVANVEARDCKDNFVFCENTKKTIALIGVEDLLIADTPDALLIAKKGESQKVKQIVEKLSNNTESELCKTHLTTHRPWGSYTILEDSCGYKIKRIVVKPGKRLSLQKHFHRNEHWIVVSGTASVEVNGEKRLIRPNESTYIKMGEAHRLSNEGKIPVVLIEAQVGEYTGEDDIIRLSDDFGRD